MKNNLTNLVVCIYFWKKKLCDDNNYKYTTCNRTKNMTINNIWAYNNNTNRQNLKKSL